MSNQLHAPGPFDGVRSRPAPRPSLTDKRIPAILEPPTNWPPPEGARSRMHCTSRKYASAWLEYPQNCCYRDRSFRESSFAAVRTGVASVGAPRRPRSRSQPKRSGDSLFLSPGFLAVFRPDGRGEQRQLLDLRQISSIDEEFTFGPIFRPMDNCFRRATVSSTDGSGNHVVRCTERELVRYRAVVGP